MTSGVSYNRYAHRAQTRVRTRILKNFCGFGLATLENPQVQKISTFGRLKIEILALTLKKYQKTAAKKFVHFF